MGARTMPVLFLHLPPPLTLPQRGEGVKKTPYLAGWISVTMMAVPVCSALNLTLSPALNLSSMATSLMPNTMVMPGMSRFLITPCFNVIFLFSLSTLRTSPSAMSAVVDDVSVVVVDVDGDGDGVVDGVGVGATASFLAASFAIGAPACEAANTEVVPNSSVEIVMRDLKIFMMILSGC